LIQVHGTDYRTNRVLARDFDDIYVVKSGHAKITVGGQVTGNRETAPTEWRGCDISGTPK
jgi:hypothetical protein